jgi:hypothetical protein
VYAQTVTAEVASSSLVVPAISLNQLSCPNARISLFTNLLPTPELWDGYYGGSVYLMKLPRWEKKLRVALQWTLDIVFERDLGQYLTLRNVESLNRLLEAARQEHKTPAAGLSAEAS